MGHAGQQGQGQGAVNLDPESADFASQSGTDHAGRATSPEDLEATSGEEDADQPEDPPCCSECGKGGPEELQHCAGCQDLFHPSPPCLAPCVRCGLPLCSHCRDQSKEHGCVGAESRGSAASDGIHSTEPPSDQEEVEEEDVVTAVAQQIAKELPRKGIPELPETGLVRHKRYCTLHAGGEERYKTACGLTFLHADYEELYEWPEVAWPLCRRKKCYWVDRKSVVHTKVCEKAVPQSLRRW